MLKKKVVSILFIMAMSSGFHLRAVEPDGELTLKGMAVNSGCYISDTGGVVSGNEFVILLPTVAESNIKTEPDVVYTINDQQGIKFTCSEDMDNIYVTFTIPNDGGVTGENIHNTDNSPDAAKGIGVRLAALLSVSEVATVTPDNWLNFNKGSAMSLSVSTDKNHNFILFMGANYVKLQDELSPGLVNAKVIITLQSI